MASRAHWSSRLGFVLATAGSAIGLGNIWRFPYLVGQNGGCSFLIIYLCCVFGLGYFMLVGKLAFGRAAKTNVMDGFQSIGDKMGKRISPFWGRIGGALVLFNGIVISSVYVIVIGWTLFYTFAAFQALTGVEKSIDAQTGFQYLTNAFTTQFFWGSLCIVLTTIVISRGVKKGIERVALWLMPILFALLIIMLVRILLLPGAEKGIAFFLTPNWAAIGFTPDGFHLKLFSKVLLAAVGQSFYSLSLGMGVMFTYGSYLANTNDLKKDAGWIVGLDLLVSMLAGLIVLPAVFAFGLEPSTGAGLTFITLPYVFENMWGGAFWAFLFYLLLFIAALTSLISIYEPLTALFMDKFNLTRTKATILTAGLNVCLFTIALASLSGKISWHLLGHNLFNAFDWITGSVSLCLTMIVCCLFIGWVGFVPIWRNFRRGSSAGRLFRSYLKRTLQITAPLLLTLLILMSFFNANP